MTVGDLNGLAPARASELLTACCGSTRWVSQMVARRPFASLDAVRATADEIWSALSTADWLEAFSHHPRIGETKAASAQGEVARTWSSGEQARVAHAADAARTALAKANQDYEEKFGFIYIVCASGRSADELLEVATRRLANDRDAELVIAAEEQRKIMRLRIDKLLA